MRPGRIRLPLLLAAAGLTAYHGGLHAWQAALAAGLLAGATAAGAAPQATRGELKLGLACAGMALLGLAFAWQPQVHLNAWVFCGGLGLLFALARRERRWQPDQAALATAVLGVTAALLFLAAGAFLPAPGGDDRIVGPLLPPHWAARWIFPNQNLLAGGLAIPAMLVAAAWVLQGRRWAWALAAPCAAALVYAGSRGVYVASLAAGLWLALRLKGERKAVLVLLVLYTALGWAVWRAPFSALAHRVEAQAAASAPRHDENFLRRVDFWKGAARLSLEAPWLGRGLGSFSAAARHLDLPVPLSPIRPIARYRLELEHAHNEWLELAVETGWPWTLALALGALLWLRRRWVGGAADPVVVALESGLVAGLALSVFDLNLRTPSLLVNASLVLAALEPARSEATRRSGLWTAASALLLLSALGFFFARQAQRQEREARGQGAALAWAVALQPLDAGLQALCLRRGARIFPWADWAGRRQAEWLWTRAEQWRALGEAPRALAAARQAAESRPYWAPGWLFLAQQQDLSGHPGDADASIRRALELEPNFARALAWQVDRALNGGRLKEAKAGYERILAVQKLKMQYEGADDYSLFIQAIPEEWLRSRNKKLNLSTGFERNS